LFPAISLFLRAANRTKGLATHRQEGRAALLTGSHTVANIEDQVNDHAGDHRLDITLPTNKKTRPFNACATDPANIRSLRRQSPLLRRFIQESTDATG
jgi:hypothetical protein